jgi:hypothetical protein
MQVIIRNQATSNRSGWMFLQKSVNFCLTTWRHTEQYINPWGQRRAKLRSVTAIPLPVAVMTNFTEKRRWEAANEFPIVDEAGIYATVFERDRLMTCQSTLHALVPSGLSQYYFSTYAKWFYIYRGFYRKISKLLRQKCISYNLYNICQMQPW